MTLPIRTRLTLWYSVVVTIILGAFAAGVYAFVAAEEQAGVDRILRERAESFANALSEESRESPASAVKEVAEQYARDEGDVLIYDASGNLVFASPRHLLQNAPLRPRAGVYTLAGARYIAAPAGRYLFVSAESLGGRDHALERLRNAFAVLIPLAILAAALCGYFLASRSLAPVARITDTASRIEAENLSDRIVIANRDDELGRLAAVLNALLQRLERSFRQQKQLLADTSHELRTPVTIIRSEAEVTLSRERDTDTYRNALEVIRSESSHLSSLIDGVLLLARADTQHGQFEMQRVSLAAVINESVQALQRLAETRSVSLRCSTDGAMPMQGNAELLRRMLLNLVENAIKFTDAGGHVKIDGRRAEWTYVITVDDSGRGVPVEAQEKIFDRFFRADAVRGRGADREVATGGGLGLSIAQWIAREHGGDVRLVRSSPAGSTFEALLPAEREVNAT